MLQKLAVRDIAINIVAQIVWLGLVVATSATLLAGAWRRDPRGLLSEDVTVGVWALTVVGAVALVGGLIGWRLLRIGIAKRGRSAATEANVRLLCQRSRLGDTGCVVGATRFGRWPASEVSRNRARFREELDIAISKEAADVRQIWNVAEPEDAKRLLDLIDRYQDYQNHSIRAYFDLPPHFAPETLVLGKTGGASLSFPSSRAPHGLDNAILFRRRRYVAIIQAYFDVLWDRAEKVLDAGRIVPEARARLDELAGVRLKQSA